MTPYCSGVNGWLFQNVSYYVYINSGWSEVTARELMKCGLKYKDWSSKEFILFDSLKLDQEQANVSFLMKEFKGTKFVRERSTGKTFLMQREIALKKRRTDFQSNAFYSNQDDD